MKLKLATRGSRLALIQANIVKTALEKNGATVELIIASTKGDRDQKSPINAIGGRGLFVKEIEQYLLDGRADIAVHSGKDLPYELENGLMIAGTPTAADSRDLLIIRKGIPEIKLIGTGSPRRKTECKRFYPDANYESIRGNVDTRLNKLRDGEYDAIILAKAGLDRLGADLSDFDVVSFDVNEFIPSACQGIIAVECRTGDSDIVAMLNRISDEKTKRRFEAERYMFSILKADCSVPLGVHCEILGDEYTVAAMYKNKKITKSGTDYIKLCNEIKSELLH